MKHTKHTKTYIFAHLSVKVYGGGGGIKAIADMNAKNVIFCWTAPLTFFITYLHIPYLILYEIQIKYALIQRLHN